MKRLEKIISETKLLAKRIIIKTLAPSMIFATTFLVTCDKKESSVSPSENIPPQTEIVTGPSGTINNDNAFFEWKGYDEDGYVVKYRYSLIPTNHNNVITTNTSVEFSNMSNNYYTFEVAAQDNDGEWDQTPATRSFTVNLEGTGESSGVTNPSGDVSLTINSNDFQIHVQDQNIGISLEDITVSGDYNGNNIYSFLAEDFSNRSDPYLSEIVYTTSGGLGRVNETNDVININLLLSSINFYHFNIKDRTINNFQSNPNLEYKVTTTLSNLHSWYRYYDILFNDISILEFIANVSGRAEFTVAVEAAKFRQTFIENVDKFSRIVDHIAQKFGTNYDPDAHYYDLYRHKTLGILTHFENNDDYATLKGNVTDVETGQPILGVTVRTWGSNPSTGFSTTYEDGNYMIIKLLEGDYTFATSHTDYYGKFFDKTLVAPIPPNYVSNYLDISLNPVTTTTLDSLIIQPGPNEGKDAHVKIMHYDNQTFFNDDNFNEIRVIVGYEDDTSGAYKFYRGYIRFSLTSMPSGKEIKEANLNLHYGESGGFPDVNTNIHVIEQNWSETGITWDNQPNFTQTSFKSFKSNRGWVKVDITSLVQDWYNGTNSNHGILLKLDNESNTGTDRFWNFYSSDYSDNSGLRPKLVVKYEQ